MMNLDAEQFDLLFSRYIEKDSHYPNTQISKAEFKLAIEFVEKRFSSEFINLAALSSRDEATFAAYKREWELLCAIVETSLSNANTFDEKSAALASIKVEQQLNYTQPLLLHQTPNNLGLREKFIRGNLSNEEWLTELDLHRLLELTQTQDKIHILSLNALSIGTALHFEREAHENKNPGQPYKIGILLNKGSKGLSQGSHWLALNLHIDPIQPKVSYTLSDSQHLEPAEKKALEEEIKTALNYQEKNQPGLISYHAFPESSGWILEGKIESQNQKDKYSCGYRALHNLFQDPELIGENDLANHYKNLSAENSATLVRAVYEAELEDLAIDDPVHNLMNYRQKLLFTGDKEKRRVKPEVLEQVLRLEKSQPVEDASFLLNPKVIAAIGKINGFTPLLTFPGVEDEALLTTDYEHFFIQLQRKLEQLNIDLEILNLKPCTNKLLDGFNAFYGLNSALSIHTLKIEISAEELEDSFDSQAFILKLKLALINLIGTKVRELHLADPNSLLSEADWQELCRYVEDKGVPVQITLPKAYFHTPLQRRLDESASNHQRSKKQTNLTPNRKILEKTVNQSDETRSKRSRNKPKDPRSGLHIDIELQQEQQVEVATSLEKAPLMGEDELNFGEIKGLSLYELTGLLRKDVLSLNPEAKLISEAQVKKHWHTWLGTVTYTENQGNRYDPLKQDDPVPGIERNHQNPQCTSLSIQAAEQLINHRRQFQYGLNFDSLPAGFVILQDPKRRDQNILHYDSKISPQASEIAVKTLKKRQNKPIASALFKKMLSHLDKTIFRNKLLLDQWETLNKGPYSRELHFAFRSQWPKLMLLDEKALIDLFKLCGNPFNIELFNYVLDNYQDLDKFFTGNTLKTFANSIAYENLQKQFPGTSISDLIRLVYAMNRLKPNPQAHILLSLLDKEPDLKKRAEAWIKELEFDQDQMDALFEVYAEYSSQGLEKLLGLWSKWKWMDSELFAKLKKPLFQHSHSFLSMIEEESLESAFKELSGLKQNPDKFTWWTTLIEQHMRAVGEDNLVNLVSDFSHFAKEIEEMGLTFYTPVGFSCVKSLPTALGRMLSILKHCKPEDRKAQWECITRLPLEPNGAIFAMGSQNKPCGFVLPEMSTTPIDYNANLSGYATDEAWKAIASSNDLEEVRKRFYLYVSQQKNRLPLEFYQHIDSTLTNLEYKPEEKARLYALLANSTTGATQVELITSLEEAKADLASIVAILTTPPLPSAIIKMVGVDEIRKEFIQTLFNFGYPPALPILHKLFTLIADSLKINAWNPLTILSEFKEKIQNLDRACSILRQITARFDDSIYTGMRFYDEKTYAAPGESIFYRHLDVAVALLNGPQPKIYQPQDSELSRLLALISTFSLAKDDKAQNEVNAHAIRRAYEVALSNSPKAIILALDLLQSMDKNQAGNHLLTHQDLLKFIQVFILKKIALNNLEDEKAIQTLVQERFKAYFPEDFFEKLQREGLSAEVKNLLKRKFSPEEGEKIQAFLARFTQPGDNAKYYPLLKTLSGIHSNLTKAEAEIFLDALLFLAEQKEAKLDDFSLLFKTIQESGSPNDFLFFLNRAKSAETSTGLLQKNQIYLTTILPALEKIDSKVVSKLDSLNLVIDLLLATKPEALGLAPEVERPDDKAYLALQAALSQEPANSKALEEAIHAFKRDIPAAITLMALNYLLSHLEVLNKPLPQPVHVETQVEEEEAKEDDIIDTVGKFASQALSNVVSFFGFGKKAAPAPKPAPIQKKVTVKPPAQPIIQSDPVVDLALLGKACTEIELVIQKRKEFDQVFVDLFSSINEVAEAYPGDKDLLISYLRYFLANNYSSDEQIVFSWNNINQLKNEFIALNDADIVRSLCNRFNEEEGEYTHRSLLGLLSSPEYACCSPEEKKFFLNLLTSLINNDKPCTLVELRTLMRACKGSELLEALKAIYASAPFPTLQQLGEWQAKTPEDSTLKAHLLQTYQAFDKAPCAREEVNGFKLDDARGQAKKMTGVSYSDDELIALERDTLAVRELSTDEIKEELLGLRRGEKALSHERLIALVAELLFRTKGMPAEFDEEGRQKLGRSFEIHTTQYLALHAMLKSGTHVTSEIGTGEGKSRIMMLMILCQYAQGKTVDFVTSDVQLAIRDYLSYKSFFQALGAKTNIIYQNTPANQYALDGINFSDGDNLSLFRNKAQSEGLSHLVMVEDPAKRALTLDEADRTYFDRADSRCNYSTLADESMRDMPWVYELLINFFSQEEASIMESYQNDIDACNRALIAFAYAQVGSEKAKRLEAMASSQLEAWQDAAQVALKLELNQDFVIKSGVEIETPKGPKIVSEARLLIDNRESKHSKFSFGVHQCLHARLNRLKKRPDLSGQDETKLSEALKHCRDDFFIDDEKQIIFSSTTNTMLEAYSQGSLYAVTGTIGSRREQEEAKALYSNTQLTDEKMSFITVPRHKGLNRIDYPLYLSTDKKAQFALLVKEIAQARQANQPLTIICENDIETAALFSQLQKAFPEDENLVRISAQTSSSEEAEHIEHHAGRPQMITVSTGMIGRGTDIALHGEAKRAGLKVLVTYLPNERDFEQIIGRAGRFGAKGEARLLLNKEDLEKQLGSTLNDDIYTATEAYIRRQQAIMTRKMQVDRLIKFTVSKFRYDLTLKYFKEFFQEVKVQEQAQLRDPWRKFFAETDKNWVETWSAIKSEVDAINPDPEMINHHLAKYQKFLQTKWSDLRDELKLLKLQGKTMDDPIQLLEERLAPLALSEETKDLLAEFNLEAIVPLKTPLYEKYDPAHDGKAALYSRSFEKIRAIFRGERALFADFKAWKENRGLLFPNLRAWWNGHLSFGQLLFGGATKETPIISAEGRRLNKSELPPQVLITKKIKTALQPKEPVQQEALKVQPKENKDPAKVSSHSIFKIDVNPEASQETVEEIDRSRISRLG